MKSTLALAALAYLPMLVEARRSAINERALRAEGAIEPAGDVYAVMQFAYPACFAAMILEGWIRGPRPTGTVLVGVVVFIAAKALKYWAIYSLGPRWTFRVLVPPRSVRTAEGPYRFLRHPNYVGVLGELVGFAVVASAPLAGLASVMGFGMLLVARVRTEERALGLRD